MFLDVQPEVQFKHHGHFHAEEVTSAKHRKQLYQRRVLHGFVLPHLVGEKQCREEQGSPIIDVRFDSRPLSKSCHVKDAEDKLADAEVPHVQDCQDELCHFPRLHIMKRFSQPGFYILLASVVLRLSEESE
jgi:hypothetical protein